MYIGRWVFTEKNNTNKDTYPPGNQLLIGESEPGNYLMAWADKEGAVHVLSGLTLEKTSFLSAAQSKVVGGGRFVDVTISTALGGKGFDSIAGAVKEDGFGEGNLTGNWGAEGPPRPIQIGWIGRLLLWLWKVLVGRPGGLLQRST